MNKVVWGDSVADELKNTPEMDLTLFRGCFSRDEPLYEVGEVAMHHHPLNGTFMLCQVVSIEQRKKDDFSYFVHLEATNREVRIKQKHLLKISAEDAEKFRNKERARKQSSLLIDFI